MSGSTQLLPIPPVTDKSEMTTGFFNTRFNIVHSNILSINTAVVSPSQLSDTTFAAITLVANSNNSSYIRMVDSSNQRSSYRIGSVDGGTADGLNLWDESGNTLIASFSKDSIRFYQKVVGPVFDVGGALASTLNAATFGTASDSDESRIQAAISQASTEGIERVYIPASMYPYSAASIVFDDSVQMVREGGDWSVYDVRAYGASGDSTAYDTRAIQEALDAAEAFDRNIATVHVPDGVYLVNGTLSVGTGVTITGNAHSGEYEGGFGGGVLGFGATLFKPSGSTLTGPIMSLNWTASVRGLNFKHQMLSGATAGVLRIGDETNQANVNYCKVSDVNIIGERNGDVSGTSTCYGIRFPESASGKARYFNQFNNIRLTDCDVAVKLEGNANGNVFTNIISRECHIHYELHGVSTGVIENSFTGLGLFSIDVLTPTPVGFHLIKNANRNTFIGYNTEMFGSAYSIGPVNGNNKFLGNVNESGSHSHVNDNADYEWARPYNSSAFQSILVPSGASTTGARLVNGAGNAMRFVKVLLPTEGSYPEMDNSSGTMVPNGDDNRNIITFGSLYKKTTAISMDGRLRVWVYSPSNRGMHYADTSFLYRNTNGATDAGMLTVSSCTTKGNDITGLYFVTGATDDSEFKVALVCGGAGGVTPDRITVDLELNALANSSNDIDMQALASRMTFVCTSISTDNRTDSISLLAVADTVV